MSISRHNSLAKSVGVWAVTLCAAVVLCAGSAAAGWKDDTGYNQLAANWPRWGDHAHRGGRRRAQIEAPDSNHNYMPDTTLAEFAGKTITPMSPGSSGVSDHATEVGNYFYGQFTNDVPYGSAAPGVTSVDVYEANNWMNGTLMVGMPFQPFDMPERVQNYSWTGDGIDVEPRSRLSSGSISCSRRDIRRRRHGQRCFHQRAGHPGVLVQRDCRWAVQRPGRARGHADQHARSNQSQHRRPRFFDKLGYGDGLRDRRHAAPGRGR